MGTASPARRGEPGGPRCAPSVRPLPRRAPAGLPGDPMRPLGPQRPRPTLTRVRHRSAQQAEQQQSQDRPARHGEPGAAQGRRPECSAWAAAAAGRIPLLPPPPAIPTPGRSLGRKRGAAPSPSPACCPRPRCATQKRTVERARRARRGTARVPRWAAYTGKSVGTPYLFLTGNPKASGKGWGQVPTPSLLPPFKGDPPARFL